MARKLIYMTNYHPVGWAANNFTDGFWLARRLMQLAIPVPCQRQEYGYDRTNQRIQKIHHLIREPAYLCLQRCANHTF